MKTIIPIFHAKFIINSESLLVVPEPLDNDEFAESSALSTTDEELDAYVSLRLI